MTSVVTANYRYDRGLIDRGRRRSPFRPNWLSLAPAGFAALVKLVSIGGAPDGLERLGNIVLATFLLLSVLFLSFHAYASVLWHRPLRRYNETNGRSACIVEVDARFSRAAQLIDKQYIAKLNRGLTFYPQGPRLAEAGGPHRVYIDLDKKSVRFLTGWSSQVEALRLARENIVHVEYGWTRFDRFYTLAASVTYDHEGDALEFALIGVGAFLFRWPPATSRIVRACRSR